MAHNTTLNVVATPGDTMLTYDMVVGGAYPTTGGKADCCVLYVSPDSVTPPTPVTKANPFPTLTTGNVASGATDSGSPVKVGGVYHAAAITLTDGQRGDLQVTTNGYVLVSPISRYGPTATVSRRISTADTNAVNLKSSSGTLNAYSGFNISPSWRYLKFYQTASVPVPGTTPVWFTIGLPPGGGAQLSLPPDVSFSGGLGMAITAGIADTDATAIAAGDVAVNVIFY